MKKFYSSCFFLIFFSSFLCGSLNAYAQEELNSCKIVRLSNPGWTDINVTTTLTSFLLKSLGYSPDVKFLSVPITFASMDAGDIDVFLGLWSPSMDPLFAPYKNTGTIDIVRANLTDAKYGLAVPLYTYEAGLKNLSDIQKFSTQLGARIYAVEPGNDGNQIILSLIKNNQFSLGKFQVIESSEQAMLAQVDAQIAQHQPIVFLAWQPHPMNLKYPLAYLQGGEEFFGAHTTISTLGRQQFLQQCPNVAKLLSQLSFTNEMENSLMDKIMNKKQKPIDAIRLWLTQNPQQLQTWLNGITTFDGQNGLSALQKQLNPS